MRLLLLLLLLPSLLTAQTTVPWLTRSHDNQRTGWNNQETLLTQASVTKGVYLNTTIPLGGDARGAEAQPLIVPNVPTSKGTQDLLLACSMANQCRAVNKQTGADVWDITLGMPVTGSTAIDGWLINQHWGALSTGVVDSADNRWYQVFWMSPDGTGNPQTALYYMAVIDITKGTLVVPIVEITGTSQGNAFTAMMRKARSSAVLLNQNGVKTVVQCTGTVSETSNGAAGFCFAFDTYTNTIKAMQADTAGRGAGIWAAGDGLACDPLSQYCYIETGNGDFDGQTQWGESLIQLQYAPPTAATNYAGAINILKGWSPYTDFQRTGQVQQELEVNDKPKLAGQSMPSMAINMMPEQSLVNAKIVGVQNKQGQFMTLVYPDMATGVWADEDLGSGGPACIFQIGYCIASGKDGLAYSIPIPGFVGTTADTVGTAANCANAADIVWLTVDPGNINPCPADLTTLNFFPNGDTAHMHMTPVQMFDPVLNSWVIFAWGENQQLHKWKVSNSGQLNWIANGHEYASDLVRDQAPGGMPGGFCAGSSNGNDPNSAILVCAYPHYNANKQVLANSGVIVIYDPIHLAADGYLKVLWSSAWFNWNIWFNKFMPPVIDGGQIYYANYNGGIMVMNLVGH
jgi:hypothetical protein